MGVYQYNHLHITSFCRSKKRLIFPPFFLLKKTKYSIEFRMNAGTDDASSLIQGFLQSLQGNQGAAAASQGPEKPFTTLQDLLSPPSTLPYVESADDNTVDNLLSFLPSSLLLLAQDTDAEDAAAAESNPEIAEALKQSLDLPQKKNVLYRVLHSPQFSQSLASLTVALREGGLPSISEALKIPVEHGGFMRHG